MASSMYVRVKRQKTTLFLHVEPTDTVLQVKCKIEALLQEPPARQRLFKGGAVLEDGASLAELRVETDDVLALALQRPGGDWEEEALIDYSEAATEG